VDAVERERAAGDVVLGEGDAADVEAGARGLPQQGVDVGERGAGRGRGGADDGVEGVDPGLDDGDLGGGEDVGVAQG
jgi:hypothetical protein